MNQHCRIRIARDEFTVLYNHLFPGDNDEHGAVLLAGISQGDGQPTLHVREVHLAIEGVDYIEGKIGYRALNPTFIHSSRGHATNGLFTLPCTIISATGTSVSAKSISTPTSGVILPCFRLLAACP